jgi:hypothetical protein
VALAVGKTTLANSQPGIIKLRCMENPQGEN